MTELPWVKWYPQNWLSEPGLSKADVATQGIWCNAVNAMLLEKTDRISGTLEQLSRVCRCRTAQMNLAISELKSFKIAEVSIQNGYTVIACRRLQRELEVSNLRRQAVSRRWHKGDTNALQHVDTNGHTPSTSTYTSSSPEGIVKGRNGHFKPPTPQEATDYAAKIGLPASESTRFLNYYEANGWKVGKNPMKSWSAAMNNWRSHWLERGGNTQPQRGGVDFAV